MANHDGSLAKTPASGATPAMPEIPAGTLYHGSPYLLVESGTRHSIGWQERRKSGPCFVVVRTKRSLSSEVIERFPLTEEGWASAWRMLAGLDADAAAVLAAKLDRLAVVRDATAAVADLDTRSLATLRYVTYNGGSGEAALDKGTQYDLRFVADKIMVCPVRSARALIEMPYTDVGAVEISGPDRAPGTQAALVVALGLLGAVLGLLIFALVGLLLGALIFGLIGAAIGAAGGNAETTIRIRGRDVELFFLSSEKRPDAVRIALSEPRRMIDSAHAGPADDPEVPGQDSSRDSVPDQLSKIASLLERGLISREEFDRLKANVIAREGRLGTGPAS